MTNRLQFQFPWAQDGAVKDPDLDTTAPSYIPDRYQTVGWGAEKPPNEWQNFLSQISDLKIISLLINGIQPFDDSITTYVTGSMASFSGVPKVLVDGVWEELLGQDSAGFLASVAAMTQIYQNHMATTNPHQDTIKTLVGGGYTKSETDVAFNSPTDPRTIVNHMAQVGKVHMETPQQVGTLPTSGGTFTGPVGMANGTQLVLGTNLYLAFNTDTGRTELRSGNRTLSIDTGGSVWWRTIGGETYQVLVEDVYPDFQIRWGNRFALPQPYLDMNLTKSISDADSIGGWMVSTSVEPVFQAVDGGLRVDNNVVTFSGFQVASAGTFVVYAMDGTGKKLRAVVDAPSGNYTSMSTLLTNLGLTTATYVSKITYYPSLSSYQKSMLVSV